MQVYLTLDRKHQAELQVWGGGVEVETREACWGFHRGKGLQPLLTTPGGVSAHPEYGLTGMICALHARFASTPLQVGVCVRVCCCCKQQGRCNHPSSVRGRGFQRPWALLAGRPERPAGPAARQVVHHLHC